MLYFQIDREISIFVMFERSYTLRCRLGGSRGHVNFPPSTSDRSDDGQDDREDESGVKSIRHFAPFENSSTMNKRSNTVAYL
jgi:hypothetical protein